MQKLTQMSWQRKIFCGLLAAIICTCSSAAQDFKNGMATYEYEATVMSLQDDRPFLDGKIAIGDKLTIEVKVPYRAALENLDGFLNPAPIELHVYTDAISFEHDPLFLAWYGVGFNPGPRQIYHFGDSCVTGINVNIDHICTPSTIEPSRCPNMTILWNRRVAADDPECFLKDTFDFGTMNSGQIAIQEYYPDLDQRYLIHADFGYGKLTELNGAPLTVFTFHDINKNCLHDPGEPALEGIRFRVDDIPAILATEQDGSLKITTAQSRGKLTFLDDPNWSLNCSTNEFTYNLLELSENPTIAIPFSVDDETVTTPLLIGAGAARPGEIIEYRVFLNRRYLQATTAPLQLSLDKRLQFVDSRPPISSLNNGELKWDEILIPALSREIVHVRMRLPNDPAMQGEKLCAEAFYVNETLDVNWYDSYCQYVAGDLSPLRLAQLKAQRKEEEVRSDEQLDFIIWFQNTADRVARHARIDIPIHSAFDAHSFEAYAASHAFRLEELNNGVQRLHFEDVNLPALANADESDRAFVRFSFTLRDDAPPPAKIYSQVSIEFDYAPETPDQSPTTALHNGNRLEVETDNLVTSAGADNKPLPALRVYPNPSSDKVTSSIHRSECVRLSSRRIINHQSVGPGSDAAVIQWRKACTRRSQSAGRQLFSVDSDGGWFSL